jgi:cytochrome c oxidase subunit 1
MNTSATAAPVVASPEGGLERPNYLNAAYGLRSWLLTRDHKRIAILYLISVSAFFALGGLFALLIRLELLTPEGDLMQPDTYNRMFTLHGIVMVFFFLIPAIPAVLGNFLVPIMIGAKDLAFPRVNLLSWYLYMIGGVFTLWAIVNGGVDTGWTFYTPFSTNYSNTHVVMTGIGIFINGFSSILTGLNFVVTIHRMRAPGMTWFRLPLFIWSHYATSLIMLLGTPVVAITLLLVVAERLLHLGIFDPKLGGDPVLYQHLFWFYSHPAVYIMILPSMGVISELIAAFARKKVFGYKVVAFASIAIAVLGFLVWGHHMFVTGQSIYAATVFSVISMLVAIPSAVKVFNWTATLYEGSVSLQTPMLYALGFIGLFTLGGLTGTMVATLGIDVHLHDTYFIVAHFHYVMVGGTIMGYLGGLHYWWPKMTGRLYPAFLSRLSALLVFVGFNLTFFPQFILGYLGMPRRYWSYPEEFQVFNVLSSAGASVLGLGFILPLFYFIWSMRYGAKSGDNPWGAIGLEWDTPSPPPTENFYTTPVVTHGPYEYNPQEVHERTSHPEARVG